jgi:HSP20 family protein
MTTGNIGPSRPLIKQEVTTMQLVRWEPFGREFSSLANRLNQAFDFERESFGSWYPPVDIYEDDDEVVLKAELPGMKKEDIDVRVENNILTLHGQRKREKEDKENGYFRSERAYGTFSRSFTLQTTVDVKKISASYKDGILTVQLPRLEETKPKQIDVKVA